ncbi:hypothetical protein ACIA5D_40610 [Actinoplanes sp. NPDC051513]|uniref:hypothetical protein n=1 Tax=Actinoplanes sp. NPDC051513 TaxID=3363908 RepID=UPI0037A32665
MGTELHVGADAEKTVVSAYALRTRTGRARRLRTGSLIESQPVLPSGRGREIRVTFLARVSLPLLFAGALLFVSGVPAWLLASVVLGTVGALGWLDRRRSQQAVFALPGEARVLRTREERAAFHRAVAAARRVRHTWPGLPGMIDPVSADRSLTQALDDLATVLVRRQEIRRLRAGLDGVRRQDVPDASRAVLALAEQRDRAERLWLETGEQANRILRAIDEAALAGESFLQEQRIGATARQAELALARLGAGAPPADAAPELADRTAAVVSAYRELADRESLLP